MRLNIEITGMHCSACCEAIATAVAGLPGVSRCEVQQGQADLTLDESQASLARVFEAIRGAGSFDIASFDKVE